MRVWITGGARGIGRSTAAWFARNGARVAIGDVDAAGVDRTARELGVDGHRLDVSSADEWRRFAEVAGPADVVVNNAGIMPLGAFVDDTASRRTIDVNLWGVILGLQTALPGMLERRRGHVINVASMMGRLHVPGAAVYGATKTAVVALGRAVRDEVAPKGVRVSTILPTMVRTDLATGVPLGRGLPVVDPEDVARAIGRCVDRPRDEVYVPSWLVLADVALAVAPEALLRAVRRLMDAERVLHGLDHRARAAYEASVRA